MDGSKSCPPQRLRPGSRAGSASLANSVWCNRRATAFTVGFAMVSEYRFFNGERPVMMANVASEGRLLSLKVSEWFVLLVSVALCGLLTLFF